MGPLPFSGGAPQNNQQRDNSAPHFQCCCVVFSSERGRNYTCIRYMGTAGRLVPCTLPETNPFGLFLCVFEIRKRDVRKCGQSEAAGPILKIVKMMTPKPWHLAPLVAKRTIEPYCSTAHGDWLTIRSTAKEVHSNAASEGLGDRRRSVKMHERNDGKPDGWTKEKENGLKRILLSREQQSTLERYCTK